MQRTRGSEGMPNSMRRAVAASFIGTATEWYYYFVHGTAAALVFPALFFPGFASLSHRVGRRGRS